MRSLRLAAIAAALLLTLGAVALPGVAAQQSGSDGILLVDLSVRGAAVTIPADGTRTFVATVQNAGPHEAEARVTLSLSGSTVTLAGVNAGGSGDCTREDKSDLTVVTCTTRVAPDDRQEIRLTLDWASEGSSTLRGVVLPVTTREVSGEKTLTIDRSLSNNVFNAGVTTRAPAPSGGGTGSEAGDDTLDESGDDAEDNETVGSPELTVALTGPEEVMQGGEATYTLTVTNAGTAASEAVTMTAVVDGDATLAEATGAACRTTATAARCTLDALGVEESVVLTVTLIGNDVGTVSVTPSARTGETTATGDAVVTTITKPETDLVFTTLSASNRNPSVGDEVTIKIGVTNAGDILVRGAYVETNVPDGLDLGDQSRGPCVSIPDEKKVRCYVGTITPGKTTTVDVTVTATAPGSYSTNGVVGSDVPDTNSANDRKSLSVTVSAA